MSLYWALGLVVRLMIESNLLAKDKNAYNYWRYYFHLIAPINRVLTLFIAFNRARIVWSLRQAHQSLHKTERDHIKETVLFGLFPGVLLGIALTAIRAKSLDAKSMKLYYNYSRFFAYLFFNVVMASLAFYIILKTRRLNLDASTQVMQRNVAAVAVVFCICHLPYMIACGKKLFLSGSFPSAVNHFFLALNSNCNILIYIILGKTFRRRLLNVLTECWQRKGRRERGSGGRGVEMGYTEETTSGGPWFPLTITRVASEGMVKAVVNETRT
jgi:hypothetical protein